MKYEIINNFLEKNDFYKIRDYFFNPRNPWYYKSEMVTTFKNHDRGFFGHEIFDESLEPNINSTSYPLFKPLLNKLNILRIVNMRANLNTKSDKKYMCEFHVDNKYKNSLTAIYYLNKCNGYTEFNNKEKTKIFSEPNKIVIFNTKMKHRMVSQTDENIRIVINLNYIKK